MSYDAAALRQELERAEGNRDRIYQDSRGNWTGGIGHNFSGKRLHPQVVELLYALDVADAEADLDRFFPRWREFDDDRQRVLLDVAFNLGPRINGFVRFRATLPEALDGPNVAAALRAGAAELLDSRAARELPTRYGPLANRWRGETQQEVIP